ncbi:hypothetical protein EUA78_00500 [TM7 phylum sp. oral taxon 351]|nr:hypothetical protein EUA78_00500 [TM7 phylum sp. oral taxon 351]
MEYKQLVYPNLDTDKKHPLYVYIGGKVLTDWLGWCLAVVIFSFGAKKGFPTALQAWNADGSKHRDYDLPDGIFVPIWWNGYFHKTYGELGHVAIAKRTGNRVQIWSSPYTHKPNFDYFEGELKATIDKITRLYGLNAYLGWTEYCSEVKVVEPIKGEKSNEEIWEGKWGTGRDRENRLTSACYDYATIQRLIDRGIGKPAPAPEPKKKEEATNTNQPKETPQTGSKEETEPNSNASSAPNSTGETLPPTKTDHHSLAGGDDKTTEHKNDEKPDAVSTLA